MTRSSLLAVALGCCVLAARALPAAAIESATPVPTPLAELAPTEEPHPSASSTPDVGSPMAAGSSLVLELAALPAALVGALVVAALVLFPYRRWP